MRNMKQRDTSPVPKERSKGLRWRQKGKFVTEDTNNPPEGLR